jgi:hypothetical protein
MPSVTQSLWDGVNIKEADNLTQIIYTTVCISRRRLHFRSFSVDSTSKGFSLKTKMFFKKIKPLKYSLLLEALRDSL